MTFKTFMGSIGNAFKTGWKNGNIQKGITATGMAAFTVGMTGSMIRDMKHSRSIFGCGCNSFGFGGRGNMFGCNPMMGGVNKYSVMSMLNNMGTTDPYLSQMGLANAYQWGANLVTAYQQQSGINFNTYNTTITDDYIDKIAPGHDYEDEAGINANTKKGKAFDTGTDSLGSETDADPVQISDKTMSDDKQEYIKNVKSTATSYISYIDQDSDGYVSEDEFIEHELEKAKDELAAKGQEMTEQYETWHRSSLKLAFAQMDLNRSGNLDWKEMTSTIATYDAGGSALGTSGGDGKITAKEYKAAQNKLSNASGPFGKTNWANYTRLFGNPEE